jgi:hypothetical protein
MEKRVLGNTGIQLSVIGFGGIIVRDVSPSDAAGFVTRAIDRGITGQGAGVAAAVSVKDKSSCRQINVNKLQTALNKQGVRIQ